MPPARPDENWQYVKVAEPLTDEVLRRHLNGGPHAGMYLIPPGTDMVRLAVFDLDDHKGTVPRETMVDTAQKLWRLGALANLQLMPLLSGGGRGIHLMAHWDDGVPARDVRALMERVVTLAGLSVGCDGL